MDRIVDDAHDQIQDNFPDSRRRRCCMDVCGKIQNQSCRKQKRIGDSRDGGKESAGQIKCHDAAHGLPFSLRFLRQGTHDQEKDEDRRYTFQCLYKKLSENLQGRHGRREKYGQKDTGKQAQDNAVNQLELLYF